MPDGTQEHLLACPSCAAFARALAEPLDTKAELARLEGAVRAERGARAWLSNQPTAIRVLLACAAAFAILLAGARLGGHGAHVALSRTRSLSIVISAFVTLAAIREALRPMYERQRPVLRFSLALLAAAGPWLLAVVPERASGGAAVAARSGCLLLGLGMATVLAVLLRALDRGAASAPSALALGIAALVANLALLLSCPSTDPSHLLRAHAPVGVFLALILWTWRKVVHRRPSTA